MLLHKNHRKKNCHANLNCKSCLWYYKWGIKVFFSTHRKRKLFRFHCCHSGAKRNYCSWMASKLDSPIPFCPVHRLFFLLSIWKTKMNEQWRKSTPSLKKKAKKKSFKNSKLSLISTGKVMKRVSNSKFPFGIQRTHKNVVCFATSGDHTRLNHSHAHRFHFHWFSSLNRE